MNEDIFSVLGLDKQIAVLDAGITLREGLRSGQREVYTQVFTAFCSF